jgi:lysophospholipase L1-like esterase
MRARAAVVLVSVVVGLSAGLTACEGGAGVEPGVEETIDYVALGDSYTAAPLVPTTDTKNVCFRSDGNYPHLVAAELPGARLTDVSCSGAETDSITGSQSIGGKTLPPQLEAVTEDTDLVTIGIGGNDFGLFGSMSLPCIRLAETDSDGAPCRDANRMAGGDRLMAIVPKIKANVRDVIEAVRDRAPDARVVVVDYPRLTPASGTCPDQLLLAAGDYAYVGRLNRALSDALRAAAEDAGVESVDVYAASRGHDVCSDDPWVNGITTDGARALALHPFAEQQQAVADLILEKL